MELVQLSLRTKVLVIGIIPFFAFAIIAFFEAKIDYQSMRKAEKIESMTVYSRAASGLVHEMQKERGLSGLMITGKISEESLRAQREKTDEKQILFTKALNESLLKIETRESLQAKIRTISSLRESVSKKALTPAESGKNFTAVIEAVLSSEAGDTRVEDVNGLMVRVTSLQSLERAKEFVGRLRATLSGVFGSNKPMTEQQVITVVELKGSIENSLQSPSNSFQDKTAEMIKAFEASAQWKNVGSAIVTALKNQDKGGYGIDSSVFWNEITFAVDELAKAVDYESETLVKDSAQTKTQAAKEFTALSAFLVVFAAVLLIGMIVVINSITRPIQSVIATLDESSSNVATASSQLQAESSTLSSSSTEAASALEETVASLEELSSMVKMNADHAQEATGLSKSSRETAEKGAVDINQLIRSMADITAASKKIEEIISVIEDIAFQTNLLALNAAVEAARAGDQGKGFAVVAEAVRGLAQRCGAAAKDISSLINDCSDKVERGAGVATQSGRALEDIVTSAKRVAQLVEEVAQACREQSGGITQISAAMSQLEQATQMNAASSEEAAASADQLSSQSRKLASAINVLSGIVMGERENIMSIRPMTVKNGNGKASSRAA